MYVCIAECGEIRHPFHETIPSGKVQPMYPVASPKEKSPSKISEKMDGKKNSQRCFDNLRTPMVTAFIFLLTCN